VATASGTPGRVVRITRYGGPEVLELVDRVFPAPAPGQVLVELRAIGVNPVDWKVRNGWRARGLPLEGEMLLGLDAAGTVLAVGAGVGGYAPGDDVVGFDLPGAYATHVLATPEQLAPKPPGLGFDEASALGVPVGTAYQVLRKLGLVGGETLLVHAGSGGVGQAAIQLGREWGARVIATAGAGNQELLRELGAEPVVYGDGLLERLRALAPGGVDVVLDGAGTDEALATSLELAHDRQRIGEIVVKEWREEHGIQAFSASVPGYLDDRDIALRREAIPYGAQLAIDGRLQLRIERRFPLSEVAAAQRLSEAGHPRGKIVLVPEPME
jgi:NADPH2:quinone reductase